MLRGLLGVLSLTLYLLILISNSIVSLLISGILLLVPITVYRRRWRIKALTGMQVIWTRLNYLVFLLANRNQFTVNGPAIPISDHLIVIANHQSWADIIVMSVALGRRIPPMKFFMKRSLLWSLPLGGVVCWLLGFPFLHRHSKEAIRRNPQLKDKDKSTIKSACAQFKSMPGSLTIYVEGTRLTVEKHQQQRSPYKHLLKPRATGLAIACEEIGDVAPYIVNVMISYDRVGMWHFFTGYCGRVQVDYNLVPMSEDWCGDYEHDRLFRAAFQKRLNALWQANDECLSRARST